MTRIVARAPNHLGDGVMALPALHALAGLGELEIQAPGWGRDLYRDVPGSIVARGHVASADVAVLFPPSFRAAWQSRRAKRRIGVPGDGRTWLLTDVVARPAGHRRDEYAALAKAAGAPVVADAPAWRLRDDDPRPDVPAGHVGLNPVSPSGATVEWQGFRALADRLALQVPVVFYAGPGEEDRVRAIAGPHPVCAGLPLPAFAGALTRCAVFVSNDSGAAHFAATQARVIVLFGSTVAGRTGPAGVRAVDGPSPPCRPCYRKECAFALECLRIPVDVVVGAVREAVG